jgi:hypothetical protein
MTTASRTYTEQDLVGYQRALERAGYEIVPGLELAGGLR